VAVPLRRRSAAPADLDSVFGALADPTRRGVFVQLLEHGPATATVLAATQVAARQQVTRQAIVKHLQILDEAGLVTAQRMGREVRYEATPQRMAAVVGWMLDTSGAWDRRIERLRRAAGPTGR
jgi:DNA-binding transcriptional ArsR family regulator